MNKSTWMVYPMSAIATITKTKDKLMRKIFKIIIDRAAA